MHYSTISECAVAQKVSRSNTENWPVQLGLHSSTCLDKGVNLTNKGRVRLYKEPSIGNDVIFVHHFLYLPVITRFDGQVLNFAVYFV